MAKPRIIQWPDDEDEIDDIETRLNNMRTNTDPQSPGYQPLMHYEGYRSRGGRGFLGAYGDQSNIGFIVGSPQNPGGSPPKSNPIIKSDDLSIGLAKGRIVSIDFGVTEAGGPKPPGGGGSWNATPIWPDITRGWWDQRMIDMLGEANFRTLVTSGTTGHPIEIPRSEANIKQGMGGFQPSSASTQINNTKFNELHDACRYMRRFVEGAGPGASGLVNPYPVDPGVLDWTLSLGGNMYKHISGGPFADEWADGLQGVIDTLGADAYYNGTKDEPTFQQMFEPCFDLATDLGFAFCIPEHGVNGSAVTAAFKGNWYRGGFAWLATIPREKLKWINWTYFSGNKYDDPGGFNGDGFKGFFDGWQAFLLAPDPGGDPPPPPPPPDFTPGVVAPMRRSIMSGS